MDDKRVLDQINDTSKEKRGLEQSLENYFKSSGTAPVVVKKEIEIEKEKESKPAPRKEVKVNISSDDKRRAVSRPRTAYKKPQEALGRDDKVDADIYYRVKDENEHLKRQQLNLNDQIKRLQAGLEKVKYDVLLERKLSDRKVIKVEGGFDLELETTKMENDKLKDQVNKMRTIIKGMQSEQNAKKLGRKNLITAKSTFDNQNEKNEYLAIINHLREQLKQAHNDIKQLTTEIQGPNKQLKNAGEYSKDLRDKSTQLAELTSKYEKVQLQFETNVKILDLTKHSLQEYIDKYQEEKRKNQDLENRIQLLQSNVDRLPECMALIEDYKKKERELEARISDLCENPFIKQAEERGNIFRKYQESEISLNEATRRLKVFDETQKTLEKENKELKEQYQIAIIDRDKFKEEAMRYKISNEEKEKHSKNFEEQFKLLGQYGEVDSNFSKIMNILKLRDDNTSWMKIDFLDKMTEPECKDPVFLLKEIERLKMEKGILGSELEKTKSLMQIQQQINEDQKKVHDYDIKKYQSEVKILKKKIEELCKLVDIERLPKGYYHSDKERHLVQDLLPTNERGVNMLSDAITEFSKDETDTEYGLNENAMDLYIGEAIFEPGLEKELGFKIANMMSFLTVDFYLHETQTSNLNSGSKPIYNLQLSFKVNVDEHFLNYLESDSVNIEVYYILDNVQTILGKGKIPLRELIEAENQTKDHSRSRVVNGVCSLYYAKDNNLMIGSVHFKLRMRSPISEVLKWYQERNQLIREISPVHDVMMKKVEQELLKPKGKVMQVHILVSKANGLKVSGAPRKIMPYFYYKFYKFDERFSTVSVGNDPLFQDVAKFDVVYDNFFHEYIEKETLDLYVLDNSRPLEVEMNKIDNNTNSINLIDNQEYDDLIGVCKIPLKGLLISDLIQNSFPIYNMKNQVSGEIFINIFWEEIAVERETNTKHGFMYETKAFEDALLIKLADLLKHKGLNINSAFEIFDMDNKGAISLVNFKDTILFTLKFTSNQQELSHLADIVFNGRTVIDKLEFYKIFSMLLPNEGPIDQLITSGKLHETHSDIRLVENFSIKIEPTEKRTDTVQSPQTVSFRDTNTNFNKSSQVEPTPSFIPAETQKMNLIPDSKRSMKEIVARINDYMIKTGKSSPVEVYKKIDKDSDLRIGKAEFANGLAKFGIPLSAYELERIWDDITENNRTLDKFDYRLFKNFYEKYSERRTSYNK